MNNDDMLRNIEYLREKADVSYEQAALLLEEFDGNVMRVLVELERQGSVYPPAGAQEQTHHTPPQFSHDSAGKPPKDVKRQASNFISQALQHHVVVESGKGEKKKTIANLSAPFVVGAAALAPHIAVASAGLMFALGYRVKVEKRPSGGPMPEDVEEFVDKAVNNIKQTASSISESIRENITPSSKEYDIRDNDSDHHDNDEGGEITIE